MKLFVLALSALLIAGCASAPSSGGTDAGTTYYAVSHKPPDFVVVYISDSGTTRPDPAYLDIDSTKKQTLYFVSEGSNLLVTFKDADSPFKVDCSGRMCTAKIDKPHRNLFPYRYGIRFTNTSGAVVDVDPIVIIDTIQTLTM